MKKLFLFAIIIILSFFSSSFAQAPSNFGQVVDRQVTRGGQPSSDNLKFLRANFGIKTIIDMRGYDSTAKKEESEATDLGIKFYSIPLSGIWAPDAKKEIQIQAVLSDKSNWPIYIHCKLGKDRTGTAVALFRMHEQCWSYDSAVSEAYLYGMSRRDVFMRRFLVKQEIKNCKPVIDRGFPMSHYRPYPIWKYIVFPVFLVEAINGA